MRSTKGLATKGLPTKGLDHPGLGPRPWAGQSHLAILLPFSPLSFPRKRESSAPKPVTRPWIPACAGMTATERSENPNAVALPIKGRGFTKTAIQPSRASPDLADAPRHLGIIFKYGWASLMTRANEGRCIRRCKYAARFLWVPVKGLTMLA